MASAEKKSSARRRSIISGDKRKRGEKINALAATYHHIKRDASSIKRGEHACASSS